MFTAYFVKIWYYRRPQGFINLTNEMLMIEKLLPLLYALYDLYGLKKLEKVELTYKDISDTIQNF